MRGEKLPGGSRGVMTGAWGGSRGGSEPRTPRGDPAEPSVARSSHSPGQGTESISNSNGKCLQEQHRTVVLLFFL